MGRAGGGCGRRRWEAARRRRSPGRERERLRRTKGEMRVRVGVRPQGGSYRGIRAGSGPCCYWAVPLLGRAAHRASRARLIHVPGRAAQRAAAAAQARPTVLHGPGTAHKSSGRAVLGPGQFVRAACWPIWPGPKLQDYIHVLLTKWHIQLLHILAVILFLSPTILEF